MNHLYQKLSEIEELLKNSEFPTADLDQIEYGTSLLYLKYSLEIVEKKLTNSLTEDDMGKIRGLRKNLEFVKEKKSGSKTE